MQVDEQMNGTKKNITLLVEVIMRHFLYIHVRMFNILILI